MASDIILKNPDGQSITYKGIDTLITPNTSGGLTEFGLGGAVNLQSKTGIMPSTVSQTITPDVGYVGLSSVGIEAMPNGTAGTPVANKGTVSNHSISVTPTVTNTSGYIDGSTINGDPVTIAASDLVSDSLDITADTSDKTVDITNYAEVVVKPTPSQSKEITITENGETTITPDEGKYISSAKVTVAIPVYDGTVFDT